jgi:sterol desaturase/sphingolipid hydroxylase (fatty acid hydroxylase superfamily)
LLRLAIIYGSVALVAGALCTLAEVLRPARPLSYRAVVLRDIVAFAIYMAAVIPIADNLAGRCRAHVQFTWPTADLPLVVRIVLYYLVADLGSYLLHRLMHTRWLWRIHKWHHAPKYMYWFAGVRATVQQQFLFNLPGLVAIPILAPAPVWLYYLLPAEVILRNDWMHMNVAWRSNWIEWIFVTPRYHHIHHSADHHGNYGSLMSIWDRVFGTRIDLDTITEPLRFGTGTDDNPVRVIVGV